MHVYLRGERDRVGVQGSVWFCTWTVLFTEYMLCGVDTISHYNGWYLCMARVGSIHAGLNYYGDTRENVQACGPGWVVALVVYRSPEIV
jgi:hypothetical protein